MNPLNLSGQEMPLFHIFRFFYFFEATSVYSWEKSLDKIENHIIVNNSVKLLNLYFRLVNIHCNISVYLKLALTDPPQDYIKSVESYVY